MKGNKEYTRKDPFFNDEPRNAATDPTIKR
jgi:hypothetical protein